MLNTPRRSKERRLAAARIHAAIVARAREPVFFATFGVKDTLDGRFDLVTLHAWLVLDRLKQDAPLSQAVVDAIFSGFDEALRELGAGDIGIGKRVKKLANAFYGRLKAYDAAKDEGAMAAALIRNVYRGAAAGGAKAMARYAMAAKARLAAWQDGDPEFGPLPEENLMKNDNKTADPPLRHIFDLGDLSRAGSTINVTASGDELARLAEWAGVDTVRAFTAAVTLRKLSQTRFAFEADLAADVVQSCVVTLEPVEGHIAAHISRELYLVPRVQPSGGELTLAAGDDDAPETITDLDYDVVAPLLEEFALAIDPYPRKQGVTFAPPTDSPKAKESPFAVLDKLKKHG
jgi:cytochrome b pre-mRNA-processing protein 3